MIIMNQHQEIYIRSLHHFKMGKLKAGQIWKSNAFVASSCLAVWVGLISVRIRIIVWAGGDGCTKWTLTEETKRCASAVWTRFWFEKYTSLYWKCLTGMGYLNVFYIFIVKNEHIWLENICCLGWIQFAITTTSTSINEFVLNGVCC